MAMLEVIIGLIFTFMLLSLLSTTINELISSLRGWRGYYMEEGIKRLLAHKDRSEFFEKFRNNPMYQQLSQYSQNSWSSGAPSYLSPSNFVSILVNILKEKDQAARQIDDLINGLPEGSQLRSVLEQLRDEGHESLEAYKVRLEGWFSDVMGQVTGWYRRHMQFVTIMVGFGIAATLNADSIQIYQHLTNNADARLQMAEMARDYVEQRQAADTAVADGTSTQDVQTVVTVMVGDSAAKNGATKVDTLVEKIVTIKEMANRPEFAKTRNILGLGWQPDDLNANLTDWLLRVFGWVITAFAISLGAPFWFDILKKIVSIGGSSTPAAAGTGSGTGKAVK
jgi:hypothetical protein